MILATINTGSFDWAAMAENHVEAIALLEQAFAKHVEEYEQIAPGLVVPTYMRTLIEEGAVTFVEIANGIVLRDGSEFLSAN